MFNTSNGYSLSDIAAASGGRNNGMFGGDGGAWWIIILFLFCFNGGWGNGWGNGGGNSGTTERYLADRTYDLNTGLLTGFSNVIEATNSGTRAIQTDICNMGMSNMQNANAITSAINQASVNDMQNMFALSTQMNNIATQQSQCCCDTKQLINQSFADLNYNLANNACQGNYNLANSTRDIIENNNAGVRSILEFLTQDKIATLQAENASLRNAVSQTEQNAFLISQLRPQANPAYLVANPYLGVGYTSYGCGYGTYNTGTGCCG
jgi:hypothetical protein